jgi:hypothetical protein
MESSMRRCLPAIVFGLAVVGQAAALDLPARKPGLWEIKMTLEGSQMPAQTAQQCIDAATDKLMQEKFSGQDACSKQDMTRSGSTITVDSTCKVGNMGTTTHAVFEGDFDSAYTVKVSTALDSGAKQNMAMQAKWLGPCTPDQKPGDIVMQGGMKMNILDMPKMPGAPQK